MLLQTTPNKLIDLSRKTDGSQDRAAFAKDVADGLSQNPKQLSSRYFYDAKGSRLFQDIMALPEYYLTRAEYSLMQQHRSAMVSTFAAGGFFHLVDLGAGDAMKSKLLLQELIEQGKPFDYVPMDISGSAMQGLSKNLQHEHPEIQVQAVVAEYITGLKWLEQHLTERKVVLFLGSNIGNFERKEGLDFLSQIRQHLQSGDLFLLGVDLSKDPATILAAYNDASGITATFNLNLLERINRELGGNFDMDAFKHFALFDPQLGVMKSFLVSQREQEVYIEATQARYTFAAWEAIHTENSHKYTLPQATEMGRIAGFELITSYLDEKGLFADMLFKAV
ncbi:L-histidine N(alpha)-methyltransferase [Pontibacter sp. HSC-14F20]|uniref:L-histidine N(alpha)-methyltransferase n=1 Tax=Pontibacter sp. HSC-14F20 TaxID=2864136 RepID=UPI001C737A71|nr:L-histidine N(alpha)-methyltransferase [Pontibacter sp. HSC-14F20]MBX0332009.1 L-histidine N(alpha)-methyltransferase [Pontibacter sp. HSC-14F20]